MSNYVLKYSRGEEVKYISHLDFVRFIQRVVRRAELPMSFSKGFNPHPLMAVALPLSVGVTSDCEYMRIAFEGSMSGEYIRDELNKSMPSGFKVLEVWQNDNGELDFSRLNRARYTVTAELEGAMLPDVEKFLAEDKIIIMKKSKSGEKEADIKLHIFSLAAEETEDKCVKLTMCVSAGNSYNLKPDTVIAAMEKYIDGFKTVFYTVHRNEILFD